MQFFVNPPFFMDEGAMHFGRGKFILPAFAPGTAKEATAKTKKVLTVAACVLALGFLAVATVLSYQRKVDMPLRQELLQSVGKSVMEVTAQLDIQPEELIEIGPGLYRIPAGCKYAGVTFDLLLRFEENEGLLQSFGYEANYTADTAKAAKSIAAIAQVLEGREIELADGTVLETSKDALETYFTDVGAMAEDLALEPNAGTHLLSDYIEHLENADYYEGRIRQYLVKEACYYEDLHLAYAPESDAVAIKLWCTIEADRTKDY